MCKVIEMEAIIERCAGLDVHEKTVVACVMTGSLKKPPKKETRTFSTVTKGLLELAEWIEEKGCSHVAMESTGIYWKPVWNILEGHKLELILANAQHVKNVPGRKTDVKDAEWIAQLLRSGLVEKSFVPPKPIRELRDVTRHRKNIVYEINREKNRVHKVLQDCNIKLTSFMSDIFGDTGKKILEKLINGEKIEVENLEEMCQGRGKAPLRKKIWDLYEAIKGNVKKHHITMLRYHYDHIAFLEKQLEEVEEQIAEYIKPYQEEVEILDSIPGINERAATIIIAEMGACTEQFSTEKHLTSWAGLCPGNNESAGKKKRSKSKKGNMALKAIMCECAWAASFKKDSRISSYYWRRVRKHGEKKAITATAGLLLRICYNLLKRREMYTELGTNFFEEIEKKKERNLIRILEAKGYTVHKSEIA